MKLRLHHDSLAICKMPADAPVPGWLSNEGFSSVTRTADELSIVCLQHTLPVHQAAETGWQALQVNGPLDFSEVGIIASLSQVLANATISVFVVSTFDTDYILIRKQQIQQAIEALRKAGHTIVNDDR